MCKIPITHNLVHNPRNIVRQSTVPSIRVDPESPKDEYVSSILCGSPSQVVLPALDVLVSIPQITR